MTLPAGPLTGLRIVEMAAIGPLPLAGTILADLGAEIVRVDRPGPSADRSYLSRGRVSIELDLKVADDVRSCRRLVDAADVVMEGFRPGVMERLGLGPDTFSASNPGLVYARMTGWGQDGPLSGVAGHDVNYIALAGALAAIGPREQPVVPINLLGDYGGGTMLLIVGLLAALYERAASGRGQVVDVAMVDGISTLMSLFHEMSQAGTWNARQRAANTLDGGAPFYSVYATSDGGHMAVGPLEMPFFRQMTDVLGIELDELVRDNPSSWPRLRELLTTSFAQRTQDEWVQAFAGTDACVFPVLSVDEARQHPHAVHRRSFIEHDGRWVPAPAPRFARTPGRSAPDLAGSGADDAAARWPLRT